jgi:GAF domain-containing protein
MNDMSESTLRTEPIIPVTLLQRVHQCSRAIASATSESEVAQALLGFATSGEIHIARLLTLGNTVDGRPTTIELREGWAADERSIQFYGSRMPVSDFPLPDLMTPDTIFVCQRVATDKRLGPTMRRIMAWFAINSFVIFPLSAKPSAGSDPSDPYAPWLGALIIGREQASTYGEELIYGWWTLVGQAASSINSIRLQQESQQRLDELTLLLKTNAIISASLDADAVLHNTVEQITAVLGADGCAIFTWDQTINALVTRHDYVLDPADANTGGAGKTYDLDDYPASREALATRRPFVLRRDAPDAEPAETAWMSSQGVASLLIVPMIVRDTAIGTLEVMRSDRGKQRDFSPTDVSLCQSLANQAAAALENARLFEETERHTVQLLTAAEISRAATSVLDPHELIQQVVELVRERFGLYYVGLFLVDQTGEWTGEPHRWALLRAGTGEAGRVQLAQGHKLAIGSDSMIGWCIANTRARIALHVEEEETRFANPLLPETRSEMALPLVSREQVIGAMTIQSVQPAAFSQEDTAAFQTMADQLANAIQNARLFRERSRRAEELASLNRIASAVSRSLDMQHLLTEALEAVMAVTGYDAGLVSLYDATQDALLMRAHRGLPQPLAAALLENGLKGSLCEYVFTTAAPVALGDLRRGAPINVSGLTVSGLRAYAGFPLAFRDDVLGTLCLFHGSIRELSPAQLALLETIGHQIAVGIENTRLFEQTQASLAEAQTSAQELGVLNEMSRALNESLDIQAVCSRIREYTSHLMDTTNLYVALFDPESEIVTFPLYAEGNRVRQQVEGRRLGHGLTEQVIHSQEPLLLEKDVPARLAAMGIEPIGTMAQSWLGAPMVIRQHVIGMIAVQSYTTPNVYDEHDRDLLLAVANQAATAIQNARLFHEIQSRIEELAVLNELAQALTANLDVQQVLEETHRGVARLLDTTNFYVGLYARDRNQVQIRLNITESQIDRDIHLIPGDEGITGYIIRERVPVLIRDHVTEWMAERGIKAVGEPAASWLGAPLIVGDRVLGVMAVQSYTAAGLFDAEDLRVFRAIANQASVAIHNALLFEEAQTALAEVEATHRRYLSQEWEHMLAADTRRAWGYLDGPEGLTATDEIWTPEIEQAVVTGRPATVETSVDDLGEPAHNALAVPIKLRGQLIGVLDFYDSEREWTSEDRELVLALADQVALALENARLFEKTQRSASREHAAGEIVTRIRAAGGIESILQTAAQEIGRTLGVSRTRVRLGALDDSPPGSRSVTPAREPTPQVKDDGQVGDPYD